MSNSHVIHRHLHQTPPIAVSGNQLEALKRDRLGQHSIRISGHWRLCFIWVEGQAQRVEIVDYH
jgi:plasmid maintenance system killer protein